MENKKPSNTLLPIPAKRYFTIGEVGVLCDVKPHVLRYWEQEFTQLKPVRRIRELLYEQGFTINGARSRLVNTESKSKSLPSTQSSQETIANNLSVSSANLSYVQHEIRNVLSILTS